MREKRATENEKIAKKALTKGIKSILKSSDNGKLPMDAAKKAVNEIAKSAVKTKVIKKTKG